MNRKGPIWSKVKGEESCRGRLFAKGGVNPENALLFEMSGIRKAHILTRIGKRVKWANTAVPAYQSA